MIPNEKFISNLISEQFPAHYQDDGELFIEFVKLYYEWLEQNGNEISNTRSFLEYQDINKTPDDFLVNFQNTYLFGLSEEVLGNRRLLIKHIKDVYRAKGTIRGWKLLYRLLFNEELDVYLPGTDLFTVSEGSWREPKYIEVNDNGKLDIYLGQTIIGSTTGVTAIVESIIKEPINQSIVNTIFLSGITPLGAEFKKGEKILCLGSNDPDEISWAPTIIGSLSSIQIQNGGQNFQIGNILKIVEKDPETNQNLTTGTGAILRVTKISKGIGSIYYEILKGGSGYTYNPIIVQYNGDSDTTGRNASFEIGALTNVEYFTYNKDYLIDYADVNLNATTYDFVANPLGNIGTPLIDLLNYDTDAFGTLSSFTNIDTGNSYTQELQIKIVQGQPTRKRPGTISYTSNTKKITGSNTFFTNDFSVGDVIITSDASNNNIEYNWITSIANNTYLEVQGKYKNTITNGYYKKVINPFTASVISSEALDEEGNIKGTNAAISGIPSIGSGIIAEVEAKDSGKGFHDNESVKMYLYGAITQPIIANGGRNYANGDYLLFQGGGTQYSANGIVRTDSNGTITAIDMTSYGSSYVSVPIIKVKTRRGYGAELSTSLGEYNRYSIVRGRTKLKGLGKGTGNWTSTKSMPNADKYIQDSYFYQNFSYQLRSSIDLEKYREMFYNLYHPAGFEMFGSYHKFITEKNKTGILYESPVVIS